MAFDPKVFATRTKTALVYAAVMLTGLLWNEWSFFVLFSIVHAGAWIEFLKLSQKTYEGFLIEPWWKKIPFPLMGWGWMLMNTSHSMQIGSFALSSIGEWLIRVSLVVIILNIVVEKKFRQKYFMIFLKGFINVYLIVLLS